jgi:TIR domain
MTRTGKWNFFVSYTKDDRVWAEWIASTLEAAGYRVLIQALDMVPGTNWVFAVDEGIRRAERTIAVTSKAYLESEWGRLEALGAVYRDPLGRQRRLLVVRVEECRPEGPLGMIVRIDIFGMPEPDARRALLDGIEQALRGRGKPVAPASFPGHGRGARFPSDAAPPAGEQRISLALDVDDYRHLASRSREQVRARMLKMLFTALGQANVRQDACVVIDRVDGLALILPASFTGATATAMLISALCAGVADTGRAARGQSPIRSRVGVASGAVDLTSWTFEGSSTATAQLLVSSAQVLAAVARSGRTPNAVIVADDLYEEAASAGMPAGFVQIPVSADASGWIAIIPGAVSASASFRTPSGTAVIGGAAVAGIIVGVLAAEEWQHLLDNEYGLAYEDGLAAAAIEDQVGEPLPDPDPADADWGDQPSQWDEDDSFYPGHDAMDDDSNAHEDGDNPDVDDASDIGGGFWDS